LEPTKRIIDEPVSLIRAAARQSMRERMGLLIASAAIYMLCLNLPVIIVEQITGFWGNMERAMDDYAALISNPTISAINEWALAYSDKLNVSFATYLFLLLVPGPLTLGLSVIWLRVLRGKEAWADMVFSGFGNFARAVLLWFVRAVFIALWSILLLVPGIIAYYRYSLAIFLLADNPAMPPFQALALSTYYMRQNKGSRFALDLSFLGWLVFTGFVLVGINSGAVFLLENAGVKPTLFVQELVSCICGAFLFAPVYAYRGIAAAEYYHRVICRDPNSFPDTEKPALPKPQK
jgi:uncharacterized membrane protein